MFDKDKAAQINGKSKRKENNNLSCYIVIRCSYLLSV
jgi:hypothetical protein